MTLSLNSYVALSPEIVSTDIDDKIVILELSKGQYYGTNNTGSEILKFIESSPKVSDIIEHISSEYDITPKDCSDDIMELINDMINNNLIIILES